MRRMAGLSVGAVVMVVLMLHAPEASAQKKKKKKTTDDAGVASPIGRPKFDAGGPGRLFVWHDGDTWNVRATSTKRAQFNGRIEVDEGTINVAFEALEKSKKPKDADWVQPLPKKRGFEFQIVTSGGIDGFTFKPSADSKELSFQIRVDQDNDPKKIFIGASGGHPAKSDFIFPAHPVLNPMKK
jgi:hypothetical protein